MDTSVMKPARWGMIFTLLSIDIVTPFYEAMGLTLRGAESFRQMIRQLILENRRIYEQNPEVIPPFADCVFEEMEARFGKAEAEHLYKWATAIYNEVHADQPQWSAWEILFFRAAHNAEARDRLGLPPDKRDPIFDHYRETVPLDDVEQEVENQKARLLSDWDLEMYSIHQFSHDDMSDPLDIVLRTVGMNRFQRFWKWLISQLSPGEKIHLWRQAQKLINEMGIWMPANEQLRYPDNVGRQS